VLRNKLGLRAAEELQTAEREITQSALIFLKESPVPPSYDLRYLCAASAAIMHGDPAPMRKLLDELLREA
jgi:hypothetical protein